jgi:hypothetical protein
VTLTLTCNTNLSAKDGFAANFDTSDDFNVDLAADATKFPFPIVQGEAGATGAKRECVIAVAGGAIVKCGASILPGDKLTSDSAGKWIPTSRSGEHYGAIATVSGASNDLIAVLVCQGVDGASY